MGHRSNYKELMQRYVEEYRVAGQPWPATRKQMARWMIATGRWNRGAESMVEMCARDITVSLREEYYTDTQGRRVRAKHAAKFPAPGTEDGQTTLWDDHRTAGRPFMERAFKGRRNQIVGDCVQLDTDVTSFNENSCPENPIPMLFDFADDIAEARQSVTPANTVVDDVFDGPLPEKKVRTRDVPRPKTDKPAKPIEPVYPSNEGAMRDRTKHHGR